MGTSLSHNMIYEGTENLEPRLALWLNLFCSSGIVREGTIVIRCILPPLCLYFWRNKSKSEKKKERKCWNYWKIWRDLAKSKTYKLEQWDSYNERVKVPEKKIIPATNTTRQKPFILPSAYKEASAFSPRWEHGHITLIPASIIPSKIIVINCNLATKWKQFFQKKISIPAWQNTATFLPARDLLSVSFQPRCKGVSHRVLQTCPCCCPKVLAVSEAKSSNSNGSSSLSWPWSTKEVAFFSQYTFQDWITARNKTYLQVI